MFFFNRKNIKKLDDHELIEKYRQSGSSKYLEVLFERYFHLVFGVCLKYLKNEYESNEAVLAIYERLLKDFEEKEIDNINAWLYVVTRNYCFTYLRTKGRALKRENEYEVEIKSAPEVDDSEDIEVKEKQLTKLEQAIEKLKSEQKQCIVLFYIKQYCYKEVSEQTGFSMNEVKSHIQNGKRNLKMILSQYNEFATR